MTTWERIDDAYVADIRGFGALECTPVAPRKWLWVIVPSNMGCLFLLSNVRHGYERTAKAAKKAADKALSEAQR